MRKKFQELIKKISSVAVLAAFLITNVIQDMSGFKLKDLFASPPSFSSYGSLENIKESSQTSQSFQTDLFTGRAQFSVPIFTPPGRRGLTPQVGLSYSSSSGNGWIGAGWGLDHGFIQRSTKKGVPSYNNNQDVFTFVLNGVNSDLVKISENEYHAKDESGEFLKFTFQNNIWTVLDKSGTQYTFGADDSHRMTNSRGIFCWCLEMVRDVNGNTIHYTYQMDQGEMYIQQIDYNGNEDQNFEDTHSVQFILEDRPDITFSYLTGSKVTTRKRLKKILVKVQDQIARKYNLTYEQSPYVERSRLTQVRECGTDSTEEVDGTCLPPQIFTYQNQTIGFQSAVAWPQPVPSLKAIQKGNQGTVITNLDVNGDGLPDRVRHYPEYGEATYWEVYLNSGGTSFQSTPLLWGPIEGSYSPDRTRPRLEIQDVGPDVDIVDLNRDGFPDRVLKGYPGYNQGGSDSWAVQYGQEIYTGPQTGFNHEVRFTAPDVPIPGGETYVRKIPNISGWGHYATWDLVDMNADGIIDRVNSPSTWSDTPWNVYFGVSGGGFSSSASSWSSIELMNGHPTGIRSFPSGNATRLDLEDLNGDALPDRIMREEDEYASPQLWQVQWNMGTGFEPKESLTLGSDSQSNAIRKDAGGDITWELLDMNQDGLPDRVQWRSYSDSYWNVYFNTGTGFAAPVLWGPIEYTGGNQSQLVIRATNGEDITSDLLDVNGDGFLDRVLTDMPNSSPQWLVCLAHPTVPDLLSTINNGRGAVTTIEYKPSTQYDNRDANGIYRLPFPVNVVSRVTQTDGMGNSVVTNYSYKGGLYDAPTREFRGFRETTVTDAVGTQAIHTFYQDEHWKGRPQKIEVKNSSGNLFTKTENTWDCIHPYQDHQDIHFVILREANSYLYDGDDTFKQSRKRFEYDAANGNLLISYDDGDPNNSTDDRRSENQYSLNPEQGILNTVSTVSVYDNQNVKVSEKYFYYDGHEQLSAPPEKGLLTKQEDKNSGNERPATRMTYDALGNVETITDSLGRVTQNEYDTTLHLFLVRVTNSLGHTQEFTYNPVLAQITETRDQNGQVSRTIYDALGRPVKTISAYDTESKPTSAVIYDDQTVPNRVIAYAKKDLDAPALELDGAPHTGYLTTYTFFDGLGRELSKRTPAEDGDHQRVSGAVTFNSRGQIEKQFVPYYADFRTTYASPPQGTPFARMTYDSIGRRIRIDLPESTDEHPVFSTVAYDDYSKTVTDPNGHSKRYLQDSHGNLARVEELNQGATYVTNYEYDPLNRLVRTTDHAGKVTEVAYDLLGRKTSMNDPNMGAWSYAYDANNNLISQTDAKNQTIRFEYDTLNRLVRKIYPNNDTIAYTYDSCPPSTCGGLEGENYPIGRLLKIEDRSGVHLFRYDKLGRVKEDRKFSDDGKSYDFARLYDALGRVSDLKYPDDSIVHMGFNPAGEVETINLIKPNQTQRAIIGQVDYNASGQMSRIVYGNGVATNYNYNSRTLRLEDIQTLAPGGVLLQQYHYAFDNVGNITDLIDSKNTNTQHFVYDDLDRLIQATGSYGTHQFEYDAVGNMTRKNDATLTYGDSRHPQAVTRYQTPSETINYVYDANGNMVRRGKDKLVYDEDNRLKSILQLACTTAKGTSSVETGIAYQYDASGARTKKLVKDAATYYLGKDYEVEYSSTRSLTRRAIFLGDVRVAEEEISSQGGASHLRFFHQDHLGSTNLVTNELGAQTLLMEYLPYGEVKVRQGSDPVQNTFTGQKEDLESGLIFYNARYYDPKIGRFITADSIVSDSANPQSFNRYSYVDNNPVKFTDPSGHKKKKKGFWKSFLKIAGIIAGIAAGIFAAGILAGFTANFVGTFGQSLGSIVGSAFAGAGGAVIGGAVSNLFQGQSPVKGIGTNAIAGAAGGVFFNANVFQPVRDGISAVTNPAYRLVEGTIRYAAQIIDVATYGYAGKAFNAFQGSWNFIGNRYFEQNYSGMFPFQGKEYGVSKFWNFGSSSPFTAGTNVVGGAFPPLPQVTEGMIWSHEMSHALQNQILGPVKIVLDTVFTVAAAVPTVLNSGSGGMMSRGQFYRSLATWSHAINPTEHALQSYKGYDL